MLVKAEEEVLLHGKKIMLNYPIVLPQVPVSVMQFVPVFDNAAGSDLCKRKGLHSNTHSSSAKYNLLKRLAAKFRDAAVRMNGARVQITDGCFVRERYFHRGKAFTCIIEDLDAGIEEFLVVNVVNFIGVIQKDGFSAGMRLELRHLEVLGIQRGPRVIVSKSACAPKQKYGEYEI